MLENCATLGTVTLEKRLHAQDLVWWCLRGDPRDRPTIQQAAVKQQRTSVASWHHNHYRALGNCRYCNTLSYPLGPRLYPTWTSRGIIRAFSCPTSGQHLNVDLPVHEYISCCNRHRDVVIVRPSFIQHRSMSTKQDVLLTASQLLDAEAVGTILSAALPGGADSLP